LEQVFRPREDFFITSKIGPAQVTAQLLLYSFLTLSEPGTTPAAYILITSGVLGP
jgi:hypothetical protein